MNTNFWIEHIHRRLKDPHEYDFDFEGCIAELLVWYNLGTTEQKDLLIRSIRNMSDVLDEEMPQKEDE